MGMGLGPLQGPVQDQARRRTDPQASFGNDAADPSGGGSAAGSWADAPRVVDKTVVYVDMSLYIVSGVVLIFLLEQFIQIGVRLRPMAYS